MDSLALTPFLKVLEVTLALVHGFLVHDSVALHVPLT